MTDERMTAEQHADNLDARADHLAHKEPTGELMDAAKCLREMSIELRDDARYIRKLRERAEKAEAENARLREHLHDIDTMNEIIYDDAEEACEEEGDVFDQIADRSSRIRREITAALNPKGASDETAK